MRLTLQVLSLLVVSACASSRAPDVYPPVAAPDSVIPDSAAAVEAVRASLGSESAIARYDFDAAVVREGPGEWWIEVPYRQVSRPSATGFRVSKADGTVDVPYPRR